ncbi:MAG: hypothetical protein EBY80_09045 [Actinobacteria bacterium]|nr:hypothetical protein [Actinomycetota bacterium]
MSRLSGVTSPSKPSMPSTKPEVMSPDATSANSAGAGNLPCLRIMPMSATTMATIHSSAASHDHQLVPSNEKYVRRRSPWRESNHPPIERTRKLMSLPCRPRQPALWPPPDIAAHTALAAVGAIMAAAIPTALRGSRYRRWCSHAAMTTKGPPMNRSSPRVAPRMATGRNEAPSRKRARLTTNHTATAQNNGSESAP